MYSPSNKHYVLKLSNGKIWDIYYLSKLGLCYSILTKNGTWTEPVVLQQNIIPPFFADIDENDCFHIIFQDTHGNIYYSTLNGEKMKTIPVLNSKTPSTYNKYMSLVPFHNTTFLFYVLQHNNSGLLSYQSVTNGTSGNPKVIDYVSGDFPYTVITDKSSNLHILYQSMDGHYMQIGYKKYSFIQKHWSNYQQITKYNGHCQHPKASIDNSGIIHMCYYRYSQNKHELIYQQKGPSSNTWTHETVIYTSPQEIKNFSVLTINNLIIVFWVKDDIIFYSQSSDGGTVWTRPAKYPFGAGRQLLCIYYRSRNLYESSFSIPEAEIPGSFINGLRLAFHQGSQDNFNESSPSELKGLIVDTLKILRENINELKECYSILSSSISSLETEQNDLKKELDKCIIRQNMAESSIAQLKNTQNSAVLSTSSYISSICNNTEAMQQIISMVLESNEFKKIAGDIAALKSELDELKKQNLTEKNSTEKQLQ